MLKLISVTSVLMRGSKLIMGMICFPPPQNCDVLRIYSLLIGSIGQHLQFLRPTGKICSEGRTLWVLSIYNNAYLSNGLETRSLVPKPTNLWWSDLGGLQNGHAPIADRERKCIEHYGKRNGVTLACLLIIRQPCASSTANGAMRKLLVQWMWSSNSSRRCDLIVKKR